MTQAVAHTIKVLQETRTQRTASALLLSSTCDHSPPLRSHRHHSPLACGRTRCRHRRGGVDPLRRIRAGEARRRRRTHQAFCRRRRTPLDHGAVLRHNRLSRLRDLKPLDGRSQSFLAGDHSLLRSRTLPDDHNRTTLVGGRSLSFRDGHRIRPGSPHRTCALGRSRLHRVTGRSRQSGAWETGSCSSCACAPAREIASGACFRQNLNDACQHRHPSLRPHYRISSCYASSLPSRASCAPSSDASRTSLRRRNRRRRRNRLSWICGTYRVVWRWLVILLELQRANWTYSFSSL